MRISFVSGVALLALAMTQVGCQSSSAGKLSAGIPEPDPVKAARLPASELAEGRRLYEVKCARCHRFYNPAEYDRAEWHMWMRKMSRKAHLSAENERILSNYLDLFRR